MTDFWRTYGRTTLVGVGLGSALLLDTLFTGPLAFVTGTPQPVLEQYVAAAFCFTVTLLISRFVRIDILNGLVPKRTGGQVPQLVTDLTGLLILFIGIAFIMGAVFKKDITALVATGGASVMILALALRDMLLAAFTGVLLNVEKPLKPGDVVKINDKWVGTVEKITWRATWLINSNQETVIIPNLTLSNAVIVNLALPDARAKRSLEVVIDYDTSVESAERILYAAALGALGVKYIGSPGVVARRMERDGVVYQIDYTITSYRDGSASDHAVIKNVLQCMRDAGITVSFPKSEVIQAPRRARIADRSLDTLRLVQQCRIFRPLPAAICTRIAGVLIERHFAKGATVIGAGERRDSLFIVGEGMVKRVMTDREGAQLITERFIATEAFGRRALFDCQPHVATVTAETAVLVYEFERKALAAMFAEDPSLTDIFAHSLALLAWRESKESVAGVDPKPALIAHLTDLHRGRIQAAYLLEPAAMVPTPEPAMIEV